MNEYPISIKIYVLLFLNEYPIKIYVTNEYPNSINIYRLFYFWTHIQFRSKPMFFLFKENIQFLFKDVFHSTSLETCWVPLKGPQGGRRVSFFHRPRRRSVNASVWRSWSRWWNPQCDWWSDSSEVPTIYISYVYIYPLVIKRGIGQSVLMMLMDEQTW